MSKIKFLIPFGLLAITSLMYAMSDENKAGSFYVKEENKHFATMQEYATYIHAKKSDICGLIVNDIGIRPYHNDLSDHIVRHLSYIEETRVSPPFEATTWLRCYYKNESKDV